MKRSLFLRPLGHPGRSTTLSNLATAVFSRYKQSGRMEDLEEVIAYNHEALSLRPPGHPDRSASLNNLEKWVLLVMIMKDLEEVITHRRGALSTQHSVSILPAVPSRCPHSLYPGLKSPPCCMSRNVNHLAAMLQVPTYCGS